MTKKQINAHPLVRFLKKHRAWSAFQRAVNNFDANPLRKSLERCLNGGDGLWSAFAWYKTKEGQDYWSRLAYLYEEEE